MTTDDDDDDYDDDYDHDDDKTTKIWVENLRERDNLENLSVAGEASIKIDVQKRCGSTDRIDLTEGRDKSQAVVKAVMNFRALQITGNL